MSVKIDELIEGMPEEMARLLRGQFLEHATHEPGPLAEASREAIRSAPAAIPSPYQRSVLLPVYLDEIEGTVGFVKDE